MTIDNFITQLNKAGTSPLNQPEMLRGMLESALHKDRMKLLLDAAFHAKFLMKAQEVMNRIGPKGEGYDKLAAEFQSSAMRVGEALRETVAGTPLTGRLEQDFLVLDREHFANFLSLASDLARLKNWEVDGNPFPSFAAEEASSSSVTSAEPFDPRIPFQLASLLVALILALLVLEPPVSTLGIITAGAAIFVSVSLAFQLFRRRAANTKGTP